MEQTIFQSKDVCNKSRFQEIIVMISFAFMSFERLDLHGKISH